MVPPSRRTVLNTACGGLLVAVVGCAGPGESPTRTDSRQARESGPFDGLRIAGLPEHCPEPDYSYHAVTPAPYPTPAAPRDEGSMVALAADLESAYLRNWVVVTYDPEPTPTDGSEREPPEYPPVEASYRTMEVLQRTDDGDVVHLEYDRRVDGESVGEFTVNYYLTAEAVARAEERGYARPGPHPTDDGAELSC